MLSAAKSVGLLLILGPSVLLARELRPLTREQVAGLLNKGQKVRLVLKSGTYAEGKVEEVSGAGLRVHIRKSDNLADLPLAIQDLSFDRLASITIVTFKGDRRKWLPAGLCSTLGTLSLIAALASDTSHQSQSNYTPVAVAFTVGLGVGGYYLGRTADRQTLTIIIK